MKEVQTEEVPSEKWHTLGPRFEFVGDFPVEWVGLFTQETELDDPAAPDGDGRLRRLSAQDNRVSGGRRLSGRAYRGQGSQ